MDSRGASALVIRLEQQRSWESAWSVREGKQPPIDPDQHMLVELRVAERVYRDGSSTFIKRLDGGTWITEAAHDAIVY